jgi:hypothetical protein
VNHYEVLGVGPSAQPNEIRDAYRRAARAAHPDRHGAGSAERMAAVNEAWRVLGDSTRRKAYDEARRGHTGDTVGGGHTGNSSTVANDRVDAVPTPVYGPAKVPWRFMVAMTIGGIALLVIGRLFISPTPTPGPDNVLRPGDCVTLSLTLEATEVACTGAYDATVRVLIPIDQVCPNGTEAYRDHQGMGTACVERKGA